MTVTQLDQWTVVVTTRQEYVSVYQTLREHVASSAPLATMDSTVEQGAYPVAATCMDQWTLHVTLRLANAAANQV